MTKNAKQSILPPIPDPRALNSVKHGILSDSVPTWEREAYGQHVEAVRGSVGARTYLQQRLADRAALALWRLDRVARWEAQQMEADMRRWSDRHQGGDPFAALHSSQYQGTPVDTRDLEGTLEALATLTGESARTFLTDPDTATLYASDTELEADGWAVLESGDPATLPAEMITTLGIELLQGLMNVWKVSSVGIGRVLLGRKPTASEVEGLKSWDWELTPADLSGLLDLGKRAAGPSWARWVMQQRYGALEKAGKLRILAARLPVLVAQDQGRAVEPGTERLEKVARYEAHLERVLYRALRELEVMRLTDPVPAGQPEMQLDTLNALN